MNQCLVCCGFYTKTWHWFSSRGWIPKLFVNQRWSSDLSVWANQERSLHERTILQVKSYSIQSCVRGISTKSKVKTVVFSLYSLMTQSNESTFCKYAHSSQNSWIVSDFLVASFHYLLIFLNPSYNFWLKQKFIAKPFCNYQRFKRKNLFLSIVLWVCFQLLCWKYCYLAYS